MISHAEFVSMALTQSLKRQSLTRTPEPSELTDEAPNVAQYNESMCTKLVLTYAAGLELIHRVREQVQGGSALDLACGPGHYTTCLASYLNFPSVTGLDLSAPMVKIAQQNAADAGLMDRVQFKVADVTQLQSMESSSYDLVSFTGAAHHLPDLATVSGVVREMDRLAKPDGLVIIMDLARLRTEALTERYVQLLGQDYVERGLSAFFDDFRNSMYAVWTTREFSTVVPRKSTRWWCHLVPRGLPTIQVMLGLPDGRKRVFVRKGFKGTTNPLISDWYPRWQERVSTLWANETLHEWKLMRLTLNLASKRRFPPDSPPAT